MHVASNPNKSFNPNSTLKGWVFDRNSDYCVQASWQGPLFLEITRPWNLATWENDFEPEFGRLCAGFLAGAFLFFQK